MARLIQFPQIDERPTPPPPLNLEEQSDGWWAGAQRCFVAIPLTATLAAVLLSASLSWAAQQQTEDIVPQPPAAIEEDYWQPPYSIPPTIQVLGPLWDDPIPAGMLFGQPDEDLWAVFTPPEPPKRFLYLPDPEEIPAASLRGQPDEDLWQVFTPPEPAKRFLYLPDPEQIPAGSLLGQPDEDFWAVSTPPWPAASFLYLPDPEEIPAGFLFGVPEEQAWQPPVLAASFPAPLAWTADEEIIPQPTAALEEDYWLSLQANQPAAFSWLPFADEEIPPQPTGLVEEELWQVQAAISQPIQLSPPWSEQEPPAGSLFGQPDEDFWQVFTPAEPPKSFVYLPDPEELPAGFLRGQPEEDLWQVFSPPWPSAQPLYLPDPEQVPAGALFGQADEDLWQVFTPSEAPKRFLYLPDPEELPAGSLSGVPEEQAWLPPTPQTAISSWIPWFADDEIAFRPQEDYWFTLPPIQPTTSIWAAFVDEEIVPQPTGFTPEEEYGPRSLLVQSPTLIQLWSSDGAVLPVAPAFSPEEAYWWSQNRPVPTPAALYLPDPEELPAGFLRGQPEEDEWHIWTPPWPSARPLYLPDPEELPAGRLFQSLDEQAWLPPIVRPIAITPILWSADEPIVPQPVPFRPDEDVAPILSSTKVPVRVLYLPDPDALPAGLQFGGLDEGFWIQPVPQGIRSNITVWAAEDETIPRALVDDYWLPPIGSSRLPARVSWFADVDGVPFTGLVIEQVRFLFGAGRQASLLEVAGSLSLISLAQTKSASIEDCQGRLATIEQIAGRMPMLTDIVGCR